MAGTISRIEFMLRLRYGRVARYPLLEGIDPAHYGAVLQRMAFDRHYGFFYARIPKAANSTVVATLISHMGHDPGQDPLDTKLRINRQPTKRQFDRAFRFTFVRDPARRILSAYLDKVASGEVKGARMMKGAADLEFVTFLRELEKRDFFRNGHFLPQTAMMPSGVESYNKIGRVETLETDLAEVCQRIFGRYEGMIREDRHKTASSAKGDLLDAEARRIITRLYANDYRKLGYSVAEQSEHR